jgi:hypothetical protein
MRVCLLNKARARTKDDLQRAPLRVCHGPLGGVVRGGHRGKRVRGVPRAARVPSVVLVARYLCFEVQTGSLLMSPFFFSLRPRGRALGAGRTGAMAHGCVSLSLYHEKQVGLLCGQHALNCLLQGPYFTAEDLGAIGREFDEKERNLMREAGLESQEYLRYMAVRTQTPGCLETHRQLHSTQTNHAVCAFFLRIHLFPRVRGFPRSRNVTSKKELMHFLPPSPSPFQEDSGNASIDGNFSIQVLSKALETWNLSCIPVLSREGSDAWGAPANERGFICNLDKHWLTLRRSDVVDGKGK